MQFYKNVYKLYVIIFFHNLIPAYAIERLFWQERGMNVQMVVYCEIIFAITVVLFELPSGMLADKFGRKNLLIVSAITNCLEFLILIFASNFWHFALVVFITGIGGACSSGAFNALLYDSLQLTNRQGEFEEKVGRVKAFDFSAGLLAGLSGGVLGFYFGLVFNYYLSLVSVLIAFIVTLTLKETIKTTSGENQDTRETFSYFKRAFLFYKENGSICFVVINSMIVGSCINYLYEFWQIYLNEIAFPLVLFGFVSAGFTIVRIPSSIMAGYLLKYFKSKQLLVCSTMLIAIGFLITSLSHNIFGIFGMVLALFATGISEPIVMGIIHHKADSEVRATVESLGSLMSSTISIAIGLLFGYIATTYSIFSGYFLLGSVCMALSFLYLFAYRKLDY